jgi:hypothetical protein
LFCFYSSQIEVTHTQEGKKEREKKWLTMSCSNEKEEKKNENESKKNSI